MRQCVSPQAVLISSSYTNNYPVMSHLFEFFLWERVDVHDILRGLGHEAFVAPGRSDWISLQIIINPTWGLSTYANGGGP